MTNKILASTGIIRSKASDKQKRAANLLNVKIVASASNVHSTYGRFHAFAAVFSTKCGNEIAIVQNDKEFSAALVENELDYEWDACNDLGTYGNIRRAAGIYINDGWMPDGFMCDED